MLNEAKKNLNSKNYATSAKMIDDVINGCKYLVSNAKAKTEQPRKSFITQFEWKSHYNQYAMFGAFGLILIVALYYVFKKEKPEDNI